MFYSDFKTALEEILSVEPTLTAEGVNSRRTFSEDPIKEEEFIRAMEWLEGQTITKRINRKLTSYGMKHEVEKFVAENYGKHKYISSGAVIAAIIYLGIPYKKVEGYREIWAAIKIVKKKEKKNNMAYQPILYECLRRQTHDPMLELIKLRQLRKEIENWIKIDHNSRYHFADVLSKLKDKLYG